MHLTFISTRGDLPTGSATTRCRGRTDGKRVAGKFSNSIFSSGSRLLFLILDRTWWNPEEEIPWCCLEKDLSIGFRLPRKSSKSSLSRRGAAQQPIKCDVAVTSHIGRHLLMSMWWWCRTFYIHTLPQKFILLSTIRADISFHGMILLLRPSHGPGC